MNIAPSSSKDDSDQAFWNQAFFDSSFPPTTSHLGSNPTATYNPNPPAQDDLFELWCCSDELCLPFADQNGKICNLSNCPSTSSTCFDSHPPPPTHLQPVQQRVNPSCTPNLSCSQNTCYSGAVCQQDPLDCDCCRAGCPPSPISLQPCIECDQPAQSLLLRPSPSITSTNTNQSGSRLLSPSLASSVSRHDLDDFPASQVGNGDALEEDILWSNKDLEELIRCCCCDEPTQGQILPSHHAHAHPSHHVNFDMFDRPSITLPYKSNRESTEPDSVIPSIASINVPCNQHTIITFKCQWKDCNLEFSDRFRLTEHVNVCHLFQPSPAPDPASQPESRQTHPSSRIDNQRITPSDIIASQSEQPPPMSTDSLKRRPDGLFMNCGLSSASNPPFNHCSTDCSNTAPHDSTETSPLGNYQSCFDLSNHSKDQLAQPDCSAIRGSRNDNHTRSVQDSFISPISPSTASSVDPLLRSQPGQNLSTTKTPVLQSDVPCQHVCRWGSCTARLFANTAELTEHISTDHVGSGKSNYTCLWEGCYCITKLKLSEASNHKQEDDAARTAANDSDNSRKTFNQRQKLMRHLQTHTGDKPFECENCGKKFGEMTTLVQHRRTHTNEKPYKCSVEGCQKSFALQSALTIHKRTHTGLKPFKCSVKGCSAQFSESSNLSKHMRTHSLVKKFECTICGRRFTRSDQLTRHLKSESIHLHLNNTSVDHNHNHDDVEEEDEDDPDVGLDSQGGDVDCSSTLHQARPSSRPQISASAQEKRRGAAHPLGHQPKRTKKSKPAIK
ncbi:hypothetical protein PtA15_7A18 [Puccinia triticina]|uniref:C2H2-type domain-containing protein n=1 Tax=Puccinia triticina TaxID=208348 RepID=A0ABY7CUA0_9BASI|nr:uncharacterized protein PtA15_7A18 [Puccinia triticina]WAQ86292.1 hypothetical protein PtA15_7A18 [Puccinia triticina]WAR56170.1 hypothetical protein PtB15_7B15 [Puccinia triticina]